MIYFALTFLFFDTVAFLFSAFRRCFKKEKKKKEDWKKILAYISSSMINIYVIYYILSL